jgi:spore cortex biosynthesis protein YabQ
MNQALSIELRFFMISIFSGAVLLIVYDVFRIARRLIKHNSYFIAFEDFFFWVGASLFIFTMLYRENDGIIRGFAIMGMAIGAVLYHYIVSELIVNLITRLIKTLISPLVFALKKVKGLLVILWKRIKCFLNFITRRLKKWTNSVRISVNKRKQAVATKKKATAAKRQEKTAEKQATAAKRQGKTAEKQATAAKKQATAAKKQATAAKRQVTVAKNRTML